MQVEPRYDDVVGEVAGFLEERLEAAVAAGIPEERVCLDPGIGFGKTPDQNLELLRGLERICSIGRPVLVGISRKSTLARVLGDPTGRVGSAAASVGAAVAAFDRGAALFRAHDVAPHVEALALAAAVERGASGDDRAPRYRPRRLPRRPRRTSVATASGSSSTSSSTSSTSRRHGATRSRTPSTTALSWRASGSLGRPCLSPARGLRGAIAEALLAGWPVDGRASAGAQARCRARPARGVRRRSVERRRA